VVNEADQVNADHLSAARRTRHGNLQLRGGAGLLVHSNDLRLASHPWLRSVHLTSFQVLLGIMHLRAVFMPPDGHCLFSALALCLFGRGGLLAALEVRALLATWLPTHFTPEIRARLPSQPSLDELLLRVQSSSAGASERQWGDADILGLVSAAVGVAFIVLKQTPSHDEPHELVGSPQAQTRHVLLLDSRNHHYYATVECSGPSAASQCVYFFKPLDPSGFLSNHFRHTFSFKPSEDCELTFMSSEHLLMYLKAQLFMDQSAAVAILEAPSPQAAKSAARQIAAFVQLTWDCNKRDIMMRTLRSKFPRGSQLAARLLETNPALLAESSPTDAVWGIAQSTDDAASGGVWSGANLLGHCLMCRRWELESEGDPVPPDTINPEAAGANDDEGMPDAKGAEPSVDERVQRILTPAQAPTGSGVVQQTSPPVSFRGEAIGCFEPDHDADAGYLNPGSDPVGSQAFVVLIVVKQQLALVAGGGDLLPGFSLLDTRESAVSAASWFSKAATGTELPAFLAGQVQLGACHRWVVACPSATALPVAHPWSHQLRWTHFGRLREASSWHMVLAAHLRLCEFTQFMTHDQAASRMATGRLTSRLASSDTLVDTTPWEYTCSKAVKATTELRNAFWSAAQMAGTDADAAYLLSWHCKIDEFESEATPEHLRARIPECKGFTAQPFPTPHRPVRTAWLPRKQPQPAVRCRVQHLSELFEPFAWEGMVSFLSRHAAWLRGECERPEPYAISELHWAEWARGTVLDMRNFPDIRELDYAAHTPTQFNTNAINDALEQYIDQEVVSFMVLGASFKADLPHQLVLNHHLMNIVGRHDEVYTEMLGLADPELGWADIFTDLPFLPARINGKGQVPKGAGVRPIDECGPRKHLEDTARCLVLSLNDYADGLDLFHHLLGSSTSPPAELVELQKLAKAKWPHENKPRVKNVRKANAILKEAADLCGMAVYVFSGDWYKCFNQYMLRPEDYWKSVHIIFESSFMANYCLTFGISPASNIAQRGANAFIWFFLREFMRLDAPFEAAEAEANPALAAWLARRRALGQQQSALLWMCCYTDDPLWLVVGPERVVRATKLYQCINHLFGLIPAHPSKHCMGLKCVWLGILHLAFLGLTMVPENKTIKALIGCSSALASTMTNTDGASLIGLLEHVRDALGVSGHTLFPLWNLLDRVNPGAFWVLVGVARERAEAWISFLRSANGSAITELLATPPPSTFAPSLGIFSDAALTPVEEAGMGGMPIPGRSWHVPIEDGLWGLTIPVMEYTAAAVNLIMTYELMGCPTGQCPFWIRWEVDALGPLLALQHESAKAPMMRRVDELLRETDAFKHFQSSLVLCHTYGPANPADPISRGRLEEVAALSTALQFTITDTPLLPQAAQFLDAVMDSQETQTTTGSWAISAEDQLLLRPRPLSAMEQHRALYQANTPTSASFVVLLPDRGSVRTIDRHSLTCRSGAPNSCQPGEGSTPLPLNDYFARRQQVGTAKAAKVKLNMQAHVVAARAYLTKERANRKKALAMKPRLLEPRGHQHEDHGQEACHLTPAGVLVPSRDTAGGMRPDPMASTTLPEWSVSAGVTRSVAVPPSLVPARNHNEGVVDSILAPNRTARMLQQLQHDVSPYALCPGDSRKLQFLCTRAHEVLSKSYSTRTCLRDAATFKKFSRYCRSLGTTPWRDDAAANSGADPVGHQRELVLFVNALIHFYQTDKPRPNGTNRTKVKPDSAMNNLRAVRRVFKANFITLISMSAITRALYSLNREFLREFGPSALTPHRAAPFTNEILAAMDAVTGLLRISKYRTVDLGSFEGIHLRAFKGLCHDTGMRKSELVSAMESHALLVGSVAILADGRLILRPTIAQLDALLQPGRAMWYLVITPPPSKSDPFGVVWGSLPIYLPYQHLPANTARLVALCLKLRPGALPSEPLICAKPGTPFTHSFLDSLLPVWLAAAGMSTLQAKLYSWHSGRAFLCCALMASGRTPAEVQALVRWQSIDSLRVYNALNPATYASHLLAARKATVSGIRGAHMPLIDSLDMAFVMQQQLNQ
jgi:ribA/ribD-fused uncharacterized protein